MSYAQMLSVETRNFIYQLRRGFPEQRHRAAVRRERSRFNCLLSLELRAASKHEIFDAAASVARNSDELVYLYNLLLTRCRRAEKGLTVYDAIRRINDGARP